jgi:hypothetical protein
MGIEPILPKKRDFESLFTLMKSNKSTLLPIQF